MHSKTIQLLEAFACMVVVLLKLAETCSSTMAQISQKVVISFKGGPDCTIPDSLLCKDDNGLQYLKLRGSSPVLARLVAGHLPDFKGAKNATLANSPQFQKLKDIHEEQLQQLMAAHAEGEPTMFEGPSEEDQQNKKTVGKKLLANLPKEFNFTVNGALVKALTPKSGKEKDVLIALEQSQLTPVFEFLQEGCHEIFASSKRKYAKSGQYCKKQKQGDEELSEDQGSEKD